MSTRIVRGAILALALWTPASAGGKGPELSEFRLENGLRGVVIEDHRAPVVTHMVWYPVGGADDPAGQSGLAHFLEHMMFKGTPTLPDDGFSRTVTRHGGQFNAFTSYDYTAYFERVAPEHLGLVMQLEADRMTALSLEPEEIARERNVVLEERGERVEVNPEALFGEQLDAALFLNHPYGRPLIGWQSEIEGLGRPQLEAFYRQHYAPDQAWLVVVGDVDAAAVEAQAREVYGPLKPSGIEVPPRPAEPEARAARRLEMADARAVNPMFRRLYLLPARRNLGDQAAAALTMFAGILGNGRDSRLGQALVETGRASFAYAYYGRGMRDYGSLAVGASPAEGVGLDEIEATIDRELARLLQEGPAADELERRRVLVMAQEIYRLDNQAAMARRYGAALVNGLTARQVAAWPAEIEAVTAADVMQVATEHLRAEASVTGLLRATGPSD